MENANYYNLKEGRFYFGGWFPSNKWGRLRLPREKGDGWRESKLFAEPAFKTVVWADRPDPVV